METRPIYNKFSWLCLGGETKKNCGPISNLKKQDQIGIPQLNGNGKVLTDSTSKAEVSSNHF